MNKYLLNEEKKEIYTLLSKIKTISIKLYR